MYPAFRTLLFRLDPEAAHHLTLRLMVLAGSLPPARLLLRTWFAAPNDPVELWGLTFSNRVGLAAGYDKDAAAWRGLACLGFGHIEVGTITPRPQPGNPQPRLFRLPEEKALINRMGFPGKGAAAAAQRLVPEGDTKVVLGANLGKNKDTPLERAVEDYLALVPVFAPLAGYLTINVSSPNTVGLRRLQAREALQDLLSVLGKERLAQEEKLNRRIPLLVKLAPDLSDAELDDALTAILDTRMDGVIATNTTVSRPDGLRSFHAGETGGLSGLPLRKISTEMVTKIVHRTGGKLPVIGVGGIQSAADAREKLDAGASLVQIYTGLVYRGPGLVRDILKGLNQK